MPPEEYRDLGPAPKLARNLADVLAKEAQEKVANRGAIAALRRFKIIDGRRAKGVVHCVSLQAMQW